MSELLNLINTQPGTLTAIATIVIAISAVVTAFITRVLARENKLLRKAETEPEVVAYLKPELGSYVPHVSLVLANLGHGPARNVICRIDVDKEEFEKYDIHIPSYNAELKFSCLPQGERIDMVLGGRKMFGFEGDEKKPSKAPLSPFNVTISYDNFEGQSYNQTYQLNIMDFGKIGAPFVAPEYEIAQTLKGIERNINRIACQIKNISQFNFRS